MRDWASSRHDFVEIEESSKYITGFVSPDRLYEYHRSVTAGFCEIDQTLNGSLKDSIDVYIDDVLCPSKTIDKGIGQLREVTNTISRAGFGVFLL